MGVEPGTLEGQKLVDPPLGSAVLVEREQPSGNAGLIGDYQREPTTPVQPLDGQTVQAMVAEIMKTPKSVIDRAQSATQ